MTTPHQSTRSRTTAVILAAALSCCGQRVAAQNREPIGRFVVDVRGGTAKFGPQDEVADEHDLLRSEIPTRGWTVTVGAHLYVFRWKAVTFGVGGELVASRGSKMFTSNEGEEGPHLVTTFLSAAPQISFNFGGRQGWSYISGGIGKSVFNITENDVPIGNGPDSRLFTINYGGGGRWFSKEHVAFTFDVRFYALDPNITPDADTTGTPRKTILVMTAGVSLK